MGMTATDELRAMLDEHDEYYKTSGSYTFWGRPIDLTTGKPINVFHNRAQPMGEDRLLVELQLATPAQAVAATLGRGKCHVRHDVDHDTYDLDRFTCKECGTVWWMCDLPACHCPRCGRSVEE